MEGLPKEALYQILINLPLKEALEDCRLNKKANIICQSKAFWIEYGNKRYWLKLDNNLTLEEMKNRINKADYILKEVNKRGLLITYNAYLFMVNNIIKRDIMKVLRHVYKILNLAGMMGSLGLGYDFKSIEYLNIDPQEIIKQLQMPTLYTNGERLLVLNFNADFDHVTASYFMVDDDFYNVYNVYEDLEQNIYKQYLNMKRSNNYS